MQILSDIAHWLSNLIQVFQQPDAALAWVALALAVVLLCRQMVKERIWGLIGRVFRIKRDQSVTEVMSQSWRGWIVRGAYWVAVFLLLFSSANLFVGTIHEVNTYDTGLTEQNIQELVEVQGETNIKIDVLIERIDNILQQNAEMLARLEASSNVTK